MRIGLISDVHLHSFSKFAYLNQGFNFWVDNALKAIKDAFDYFARNNVDFVIFLGDTFNVGQNIETGLMNIVHDFFLDLKTRYGKEIILIAGNHDQKSNGSEETVLKFLRESCTIYTTPDRYGSNIGIIPYTEDYDMVRSWLSKDLKGCDYIFGHLSIDGAIMGVYEYKPKNHLSPKDFENHKGVYLGHYHKRQKLNCKNHIEYIGSLRALDFGESNDGDKGFCILDTDKSVQTQIIKSQNPDFSIVNDVKDDILLNNSFVRYDYKGVINEDEIREQLKQRGVLHVEFNKLDVRKNEERVISENSVKTDVDYMKHIIETTGQGFDKDRLLKCGMECLTLSRE